MKIFQIKDGFCYWDASNLHPSLDHTIGRYSAEIVFVEAPDYVREGWGFDAEETGDARFIQPEAPEGWLYDVETGTFYQEGEITPSEQPTAEEQLRADLDYIAIMTGVEL